MFAVVSMLFVARYAKWRITRTDTVGAGKAPGFSGTPSFQRHLDNHLIKSTFANLPDTTSFQVIIHAAQPPLPRTPIALSVRSS
jgi:hypothetical protein